MFSQRRGCTKETDKLKKKNNNNNNNQSFLIFVCTSSLEKTSALKSRWYCPWSSECHCSMCWMYLNCIMYNYLTIQKLMAFWFCLVRQLTGKMTMFSFQRREVRTPPTHPSWQRTGLGGGGSLELGRDVYWGCLATCSRPLGLPKYPYSDGIRNVLYPKCDVILTQTTPT